MLFQARMNGMEASEEKVVTETLFVNYAAVGAGIKVKKSHDRHIHRQFSY